MAYKIERDGTQMQIAFAGVLRVDEWFEALEALRSAGIDETTTLLIVDMTELEAMDFSVEDTHRFLRASRYLFDRGPEFQVVIAVSRTARSDIEDYLFARDELTSPQLQGPDPITIFETMDEVHAWAASTK